MRSFLDRLSWPSLLLFAGVLAILPPQPEPHLVHKARWLVEGRPFALIDVLDVVMHLSGVIVIVLKLAFGTRPDGGKESTR
jgi:hypothetical protein